MKMKTRWLAVALAALLLFGCAPAPAEPPTEEEAASHEEGVEETNHGENTDQSGVEAVTAQGRLNGRIDGNSVEIEVDGVPMAYRTEELIKGDLASIEDGEEVVFTYYENAHGQRMLRDISVK